MNDILKAMRLFEAATPENPVKLRVEDGAGQHLDLLALDATVCVKFSDGTLHKADELIDICIGYTYEGKE